MITPNDLNALASFSQSHDIDDISDPVGFNVSTIFGNGVIREFRAKDNLYKVTLDNLIYFS